MRRSPSAFWTTETVVGQSGLQCVLLGISTARYSMPVASSNTMLTLRRHGRPRPVKIGLHGRSAPLRTAVALPLCRKP